ncbi:hypothetical protein HDU93_005233 [Gonapodya sp. JEL0774]|nr:hypothetical protein HDU93_005233 [Gonapodya sp. JEL0774]
MASIKIEKKEGLHEVEGREGSVQVTSGDGGNPRKRLKVERTIAEQSQGENSRGGSTRLPNEILMHVLRHVHRPPDLLAFVLCSRSSAALAVPYLWRRVFLKNAQTVNILSGLDRTGRKEIHDWDGGMFDYWQHVEELVFIRAPPSQRVQKPISKHSIHNIIQVMTSDADAAESSSGSRALPRFRTLRFLSPHSNHGLFSGGSHPFSPQLSLESYPHYPPAIHFESQSSYSLSSHLISSSQSSWTTSPLLTPELFLSTLDVIIPHQISTLDLSGCSLTRPIPPAQIPALISILPKLRELHQPHHVLYSSSLEMFLREVGHQLDTLTLDLRTASGAVKVPSWESWKGMRLKVCATFIIEEPKVYIYHPVSKSLTLATSRVLGKNEREGVERYLSNFGGLLNVFRWAVCGQWRTRGFSQWELRRTLHEVTNLGDFVTPEKTSHAARRGLSTLHLSYPTVWSDQDFHQLLVESMKDRQHVRLSNLSVTGELVEDYWGVDRPYAKYALMAYIQSFGIPEDSTSNSDPDMPARETSDVQIEDIPESEPSLLAPVAQASNFQYEQGLKRASNRKGKRPPKWGEMDYVPPWDLELEQGLAISAADAGLALPPMVSPQELVPDPLPERQSLPLFVPRTYPYPEPGPSQIPVNPLRSLHLSGIRGLSERDIVIIVQWMGSSLRFLHIDVDGTLSSSGSEEIIEKDDGTSARADIVLRRVLPAPHWVNVALHLAMHCKRLVTCVVGVLMPTNVGLDKYLNVYTKAGWDVQQFLAISNVSLNVAEQQLVDEVERGVDLTEIDGVRTTISQELELDVESVIVKVMATECSSMEVFRYPVLQRKGSYPAYFDDNARDEIEEGIGDDVGVRNRRMRTWGWSALESIRGQEFTR